MKIAIPFQIRSIFGHLKPLSRHHYFFAVIILLGILGWGIFSVNDTLGLPTDDEYRLQQMQSTIGTKFNQGTKEIIAKIESLQKSGGANSPLPPLPPGRINPFAE